MLKEILKFPTKILYTLKTQHQTLKAGLAIGLLTIIVLQSFFAAPGTAAQEPPAAPTDELTTQDSPIVVDHTSVALFEEIPDQYIQAAENLDMLFIDRSVGANIDGGLDCLNYPTDEDAPNHCIRYEHTGDSNFSVDPSEVNWARPGGYDRSNWDFLHWDNFPAAIKNANGNCSSWDQKAQCFIDLMTNSSDPLINQYDVASYQFSYLLVDSGSSIADQPGGYIWDNAGASDVYDLAALETAYPNKTFIYWTTSLSRFIGTSESETFNNQMRQYAQNNDKILFDVADILSHDPDGNPCYDNRDGVPYANNNNNSENYPDDGLDIPAICQHYTTETDGGHLGSVSAGKIRVSKAFWVLMAQIAGWNPDAASTSPTVESVTPASNADNVLLDQGLVINFSEAMSTGSVSYSLTPNPGGLTPSWNGSHTQLTLTHNDFTQNTQYTAQISAGTDPDGNSLSNAPYTWVFTTTGPRANLDITKQPSTNETSSWCFMPDCFITYNLSLTNPGPTFPVSATVITQWTPPDAIERIVSTPAGCSGDVNAGSVTCNNINLPNTTPVNLEVVLEVADLGTNSAVVQSTALITINNPEILDPPGNNSAINAVFINPELNFLPIIIKN